MTSPRSDLSRPPAGIHSHQDFAWLIGRFATETAGVTHALLVSLDGLQLVASDTVNRDLGDQLAALTSGLISMADRSAGLLNLGLSEYLTVRLPGGHLLFMRVVTRPVSRSPPPAAVTCGWSPTR